MRAQIAEAERRGDIAGLGALTQRKMELDRALRATADSQPRANRGSAMDLALLC